MKRDFKFTAPVPVGRQSPSESVQSSLPNIDDLRAVRNEARELVSRAATDLAAYLHKVDEKTFVRLPDSRHEKADVGVTVTASCLMGLAQTESLDDEALQKKSRNWSASESFKEVLSAEKWCSSGLLRMNAFTSTLVLRAFGFLVERGVYTPVHARHLFHKGQKEVRDNQGKPALETKKKKWSLLEIAFDLAKTPVSRLRVEKYPPSAALVYWFLDALDRGSITDKFGKEFWSVTADWSAKEFWKQQSLVVAENDVLMDPIAMAMGAALCKKLKNISERLRKESGAEYLKLLPSDSELAFSLELLFSLQARSGIWGKYFPLFHYPDAGGNFCFTFEMLEALLTEFSKDGHANILDIPGVFSGLRKALEWCVRNRFEFQIGDNIYRGWNSGGQVSTLANRKPESWATAVVHMFLWELDLLLSNRIQDTILDEYKAVKHLKDKMSFEDFADISILLPQPLSLKTLILDHIIEPASHVSSLRKQRLTEKVSALLFGPPGTSKTELCTAVAKYLGWPLLQIDPSHFLRNGIGAISVTADKIFSDLLDLSGVVILFDEMDALVQTRDDEESKLDITSQLLTTSMLPKLAKLHNNARSIFFMATNFQNRFDPAIKRAGRFDLLLCMGPPNLTSKTDQLRLFVSKKVPVDEISKASLILKKFVREDAEIAEKLTLFTYGEFRAFLKELRKEYETLNCALEKLKLSGFKTRLINAAEYNLLRLEDLSRLKEKLSKKSLKDIFSEKVTFTWLKSEGVELVPIVRYIADSQQSKIQ